MTRTILTLMILTLAATTGCGGDDQQATETPPVNEQAAVTVGSKPGDQAPDFNLSRIGGGELRLSDLRGKAVIIDFWDTWCPPCREALPHLEALSVEYKDQLEVVGVAIGREGREAVAKYANDHKLTFPMVLIDEKYATARDFGGVQSIPTTFLIDGDGIVRKMWVGAHPKATYEEEIKKVVGA